MNFMLGAIMESVVTAVNSIIFVMVIFTYDYSSFLFLALLLFTLNRFLH